MRRVALRIYHEPGGSQNPTNQPAASISWSIRNRAQSLSGPLAGESLAGRRMPLVRKIDQLRSMMAAGDWRSAVSLASKFADLGDVRRRILCAQEAFQRPDFQRQLGRSPEALIEDGIAALKERYVR